MLACSSIFEGLMQPSVWLSCTITLFCMHGYLGSIFCNRQWALLEAYLATTLARGCPRAWACRGPSALETSAFTLLRF